MNKIVTSIRILNKGDIVIPIILFGLVVITRLPFVEQYQSHWDGPQYSIAIATYSFENQTPAPPGYPIYIALGKFINYFVQNPHYSLLLENIIISAFGVIIIYYFGKKLMNKAAGLSSAFLYITSPVIYFFGLTAYAYGVDAVFYLLFAFIVYEIMIEQKEFGIWLGISYALLLGIRPQDFLYTWPLFSLGLIFLKNKEKIKTIFSFVIVFVSWFVPLAGVVGSFNKYFTFVSPTIGAKLPVVSLYYAYVNREILIKGVVLTTGISFLALIPFLKLIYSFKTRKKITSKLILFFVVWVFPPLLFNLLIRSDHAGYQLSYLMPIILLIGMALVKISDKKISLVYVALLILCLFNLALFFRNRDPGKEKPYVPTSFHYSEIRKNDIRMGSKINYINSNFNPLRAIIVIGLPDSWRPVMYHLKKFQIYQTDRLVSTDARFIDINRYALNWKSKESKNKNFVLKIPTNITDVIFYDDNAFMWRNNKSCRRVLLSGNSSVCVLSVTTGEYLRFNYNSYKIN